MPRARIKGVRKRCEYDSGCEKAASSEDMGHSRTIPAAFIAWALVACGDRSGGVPEPAAPVVEKDAASLLDDAIGSAARTEADRARDAWRRPRETLRFFGVEPTMTVVEVWPGGGWYARIIAPYLHAGGGEYRAAMPDAAAGTSAAEALERFRAEFADASRFGTVRAMTIERAAAAGDADVVLTFRNVHNWIAADSADETFAALYAALKPGGVLGIVDHRADESANDDVASGYVKESTVMALATAAGFEFVAAAEINANPADTKDHPFGVWTLAPTRRSAASTGQADPNFDRAKYDAIGESDRMTLKFAKPR
jgi:predicted methyltransferase